MGGSQAVSGTLDWAEQREVSFSPLHIFLFLTQPSPKGQALSPLGGASAFAREGGLKNSRKRNSSPSTPTLPS